MFSQLKEAFILAGGESLLSFFCSTSFSLSYEGWKQGACLGVEVRCVVPYMFVHVRMECAAFVCVCRHSLHMPASSGGCGPHCSSQTDETSVGLEADFTVAGGRRGEEGVFFCSDHQHLLDGQQNMSHNTSCS